MSKHTYNTAEERRHEENLRANAYDLLILHKYYLESVDDEFLSTSSSSSDDWSFFLNSDDSLDMSLDLALGITQEDSNANATTTITMHDERSSDSNLTNSSSSFDNDDSIGFLIKGAAIVV